MEQLAQNSAEQLRFCTRRGRPVLVRPVRPDDMPLLADLLARLSKRSRWLRYMTARPLTVEMAWAEAVRMTSSTHEHVTLVATGNQGGAQEALAVAELVRDPRSPCAGEIALVVRDDEQAGGIGSVLAARLMQIAQAIGITTLHADVFAGNRGIHMLIQRIGVPYTASRQLGTAYGVVTLPPQMTIELPIAIERVTAV